LERREFIGLGGRQGASDLPLDQRATACVRYAPPSTCDLRGVERCGKSGAHRPSPASAAPVAASAATVGQGQGVSSRSIAHHR
jgi:hypothetical protein